MKTNDNNKIAVNCHSGFKPESREFSWIPAFAGMTKNRRGMTLTEMMIVIGLAAIMVGLTIPAANMLSNSFESKSGAESMINGALASARAIAIKEQHYAGIRFQKRYDLANPDPINASQYMIFIVDTDGNQTNSLQYGFRAVDGIQPIKLPDSIGVMDMIYDPALAGATLDDSYSDTDVLRDTTTFSIIFSPSGKLVMHLVRVRNRDEIGDYQSYTNESMDDIFNKKAKVDSGLAMFYQDDYSGDIHSAYPNLGLGQESSRRSFVIYNTKLFRQAYDNDIPYTGYLGDLKPVFINPYSGTIVSEK